MKRVALFAVMLGGPALAAAQTGQAPPRLEAEVRTMGFAFDNLFQAPRGEPSEDVRSLQAEARLYWRLRAGRPLQLHARASATDYDSGLDTSTGVGLGLRSQGRPAAFEVLLEQLRDRPSLDVGERLDAADVTRLTGEYSYRVTDSWQVAALGEAEAQRYDSGRSRNNQLLAAGAALRYRGWGYDLLPEVGATWGERDVDDASETHDQRQVWIKVTTVPFPRLYLSARYRWREREYTTADSAASNFGREDDRRQLSLTASLRTADWLRLDAYLADEDAESTRRDRTYDSRVLGIGATLRF